MDVQPWEAWVEDWSWALACMRRKGYETAGPDIAPPLPVQAMEQIQSDLNIRLPDEFVRVATGFSPRVTLRWHRGKCKLPGMYRLVSSSRAEALWDANSLARYQGEYDEWIRDCFCDPEDPYHRIWHGKLPFMVVPNGDMIAFDPATGSGRQPVVYLSHEDGQLHGCTLGADFLDFMSRWSSIGCPGPEDWQIAPFYDATEGQIMDSGEVVEGWKRLLGESTPVQ